jgi:hypothetical protein
MILEDCCSVPPGTSVALTCGLLCGSIFTVLMGGAFACLISHPHRRPRPLPSLTLSPNRRRPGMEWGSLL